MNDDKWWWTMTREEQDVWISIEERWIKLSFSTGISFLVNFWRWFGWAVNRKQGNSTYLSHYVQSQTSWIYNNNCENGLNQQGNEVVESKHQGIAFHAQIDGDLEPNGRLAGQSLPTGKAIAVYQSMKRKWLMEMVHQRQRKWCYIWLFGSLLSLKISLGYHSVF